MKHKRDRGPDRSEPKRWCANCGELYEIFKGRSYFPRKYCSLDCARAAVKARAIAKYPPREEFLALYEQGWGVKRLAAHYGKSAPWAVEVRNHYDIQSRPPGSQPDPTARWVNARGYVVRSQRLEHRIVMEEKLGRPLRKGEVVHHIDGDKANNDPSNLILFPSNSEHMWSEVGTFTPFSKSPARARRDWTEPRKKVEFEGACRVCGREGITLDPAHIIARSRVGPGEGEHYDNIVPLCRERCHRAYDEGDLDLLPFLTLSEQAKATRLVGLVEALQRTTNTRLAA
jgi:hypothetical protein